MNMMFSTPRVKAVSLKPLRFEGTSQSQPPDRSLQVDQALDHCFRGNARALLTTLVGYKLPERGGVPELDYWSHTLLSRAREKAPLEIFSGIAMKKLGEQVLSPEAMQAVKTLLVALYLKGRNDAISDIKHQLDKISG